MKHMNLSKFYISSRMVTGFQFVLDMHRSSKIEIERKHRSLYPVGSRMFMDAVQGYLAGFSEGADELVSKAEAFLEMAHSIGEKQGERGITEAVGTLALSYTKWLRSAVIDPDLLAEARSRLDSHFDQAGTLDRRTAEYVAPWLLYSHAYSLTKKMADRLVIETDSASRTRSRGLFGHTLSIASAEAGPSRQIEEEKLRMKIGKPLFAWITHGHYDNVAYALHALFPRPDGPPSKLIEKCWDHIPENVIAQWLEASL